MKRSSLPFGCRAMRVEKLKEMRNSLKMSILFRINGVSWIAKKCLSMGLEACDFNVNLSISHTLRAFNGKSCIIRVYHISFSMLYWLWLSGFQNVSCKFVSTDVLQVVINYLSNHLPWIRNYIQSKRQKPIEKKSILMY